MSPLGAHWLVPETQLAIAARSKSITDNLVAAMRSDHGVSLSSAPTNRDMWREPVELAKQRLDHSALMDRATIAKPDTNAPVIKAALKRDPPSNPFRLTDTKIE